jgi:hypothetical protein
MMPLSLGAGRMQFEAGNPAGNGLTERVEALAARAEALWRRICEIESALAAREWWLLGRAVPEARLVAEISSLLAVARGEMENALIQGFGLSMPRSDATDQYSAIGRDDTLHTEDPAWVSTSRAQAIGLLRMVAASLPAMLQYAQMLRTYSDQLAIPTAALDSLGIVADRMNEIGEALRTPPQ